MAFKNPAPLPQKGMTNCCHFDSGKKPCSKHITDWGINNARNNHTAAISTQKSS